MARKGERFVKEYAQGTMNVTEIWVDQYTGVNYMYHAAGYSGGLTPLLDPMGNVIVTPTEYNQEYFQNHYAGTHPNAGYAPDNRQIQDTKLLENR